MRLIDRVQWHTTDKTASDPLAVDILWGQLTPGIGTGIGHSLTIV